MQVLQLRGKTYRVADDRTAAAEQDVEADCNQAGRLFFLRQMHDVVMDVVRHLVAENARQLFSVLYERHKRQRHIDVSAGDGKRIWLLLVHQNEAKRILVLPVTDARDALPNLIENRIPRRGV